MGECYPGIATISKKCSMTERTVQRHLRWLFDKSLIQEYWEYADKLRTKRVRHFRILIPDTDSSDSELPVLHARVAKGRDSLRSDMHILQSCRVDRKKGRTARYGEVTGLSPVVAGRIRADNVTLSCRPVILPSVPNWHPPIHKVCVSN